MIHFRHIWLSSILMNPHPHHLLWQLQSISIVPLYTLLMTTALPSPSLPYATMTCIEESQMTQNTNRQKIFFLDRIIIITVEYSRVLD